MTYYFNQAIITLLNSKAVVTVVRYRCSSSVEEENTHVYRNLYAY